MPEKETDLAAEVYNWRIYTFAIVASFGALTFVSRRRGRAVAPLTA